MSNGIITGAWASAFTSAGAAIALLSSTIAGAANGGDITTSAINTTGASLIVVAVSYNGGSTGYGTLSDSAGNTWSVLTSASYGIGNANEVLFYCASPTTNASHTFTVSGSYYASLGVMAFSGTAASPLDQKNTGLGGYGSTTQPGSVTPGQNNELLVTGLGFMYSTSTHTIDSSFNTPLFLNYDGSGHYGLSMSYLVQTTASTKNPTWTIDCCGQSAASIATFKAA